MGLKDLFIVSDKKEEDIKDNSYDTIIPTTDESSSQLYYTDNTTSTRDYSSSVEDIYNSSDILNNSNSIFKIEELRSNLPDTLPTNVKCESVKGILKSFGLDINDIVSDGYNRIDLLNKELDKRNNDISNKINSNSELIEDYKYKISELQEEISFLNSDRDGINKVISEEISRIDSLIKFISSDNKKKEDNL